MAKMPDAAKFRDWLTLQKKVNVSDGHGGNTVTWQDVVGFWGKLEPLSASQRFFAEQMEHVTTHRCVTRYNRGDTFQSDHRIKWQNRIFQIVGFRDLEERKRFMELQLQENVGA